MIVKCYKSAQDLGNDISCCSIIAQNLDFCKSQFKKLNCSYAKIVKEDKIQNVAVTKDGQLILLDGQMRDEKGRWLLFYHRPKTLL